MRRPLSAIIAISVAAIDLLAAVALLAQTDAGLLEGTAARLAIGTPTARGRDG